MSRYKIKPADPKEIKTYPLRSRPSKVTLDILARPMVPGSTIPDFLGGLPDVLAARDFRMFLNAMSKTKKEGRPILFGLGAHVIKVGLNPVIINMMEQGWISAIVLNGAGIIHDFELAYAGKTSEDVAVQIAEGHFGMAEETGDFLNSAIQAGDGEGLGLGESVGKKIAESDFPHKDLSLLGSAYELGIPVTVHVAIGTDTIHFHPKVDGGILGRTSLKDFFLLCSLVEDLNGGVFCCVGSAVIIPEVLLKSISFARNRGVVLEEVTTAVFDFNMHYRPDQNIVKRPFGKKGRGYYFIGHHELMIPLLSASLTSLGGTAI